MNKNLCLLLLLLVCTHIHAQKNREDVDGFPGYEEIFKWVEARKNLKVNYDPYSGSTDIIKETVWTKNGTQYASANQKDEARFHAATGENEDYGEAFEGMLQRPECVYNFSVSPTSIKVVTTDKIQVACNFDSRTGNEKAPKDGAAEAFHCKSGTRSYTAEVQTVGGPVKLRYTVTCTHQNVRKSRKTIEGGWGVPDGVMITTGGGAGYRTRTSSSDYYPPYHQIHKQTTTFNLDESARLSGISKKELATRLLMTADLELPLVDPQYLNESYGNTLTYIVGYKNRVGNSFSTVDANLFIYFMAKTFGLTEDEISDKKARAAALANVEAACWAKIEEIKQLFVLHEPFNDKAVQQYLQAREKALEIAEYAKKYPSLAEVNDVCTKIFHKAAIIVVRASAESGKLPLDDLESYFKEAEEQLSEPPINLYVINAIKAYERGDYRQSILYDAKVIDLMPKAPYSKEEKQMLLDKSKSRFLIAVLHEGNFSYAHTIADQEIQQDSDRPFAYALKCWVYVYQNDRSNAMRVYNEDVLRLDPEYPTRKKGLNDKLRELGWIQ